jgi:hypothetical protein
VATIAQTQRHIKVRGKGKNLSISSTILFQVFLNQTFYYKNTKKNHILALHVNFIVYKLVDLGVFSF